MPSGSPGEDVFLILERQHHPRAIGHDLAVLDFQVLLYDLRDAKVAQGLGCRLDRPLRGVLPRSFARSDHFRDPVDSVGLGHRSSPVTSVALPGRKRSGMILLRRWRKLERYGSRRGATMDLILWRHADAEAGSPDSARK